MPDPKLVPPPVQVDWNAFAGSLTAVLRDELVGILEGTQTDIQNFLVDITHDMTRALRMGNSKLSEELRNQVLGLIELNRLRVAGTHLRILDKILDTALGIGSALLGNVVGMAITKLGGPAAG